jgi:hypothetical protein
MHSGVPSEPLPSFKVGDLVKFMSTSLLRHSYKVGPEDAGKVTELIDDGTALRRINVQFPHDLVQGAEASQFEFAAVQVSMDATIPSTNSFGTAHVSIDAPVTAAEHETPTPLQGVEMKAMTGREVPPPSSYAGGFDNLPPRPRLPEAAMMGRDAAWMAHAAAAAAEAERQRRLTAPLASANSDAAAGLSVSDPSASSAPQVVELTARTQIGQQTSVGMTVTRATPPVAAEVRDDQHALLDVLPQQITTASQFTLSSDGRIDLAPDPPSEGMTIDAIQRTQYDELRHKAIEFSGLGHNHLGDLWGPVNRFVAAAPEQIEGVSIIRLWSRGNTLRRRLKAHDIAVLSPDPTDPARLPTMAAETLRDLVETYNIFIVGDPKGRELDQVRLGPQDRQAAQMALQAAAPIVEAVQRAEGVATAAAVQALSEQIEAAREAAAPTGIDTDQAIDLATKSAGNFVAQAVRAAYAAVVAKMKTEGGFALKEYRAGIYRAAGAATFVAATGAALFSPEIVAFVARNAEALKTFAERAFDNPALIRAIDLITQALGVS